MSFSLPRRLLLVISLIWAAVLCAYRPVSAAWAQPTLEVVPEAEFWERLTAMQADLHLMPNPLAEEQVAQLHEWADQLDSITAVTRGDGRTIPLSLSAFTTALRAESPDLARLDAQLQALLTMQETSHTATFSTTDLQPLTDILQQDMYQYAQEPSRLQQQWQALRDRINEWLLSVLPNYGETATNMFDIFLLVAATVVLILVLYYILGDLFANFVADATLHEEDALGTPLTADIALQRAQTFSSDGDYRTAVRYLYLSMLLLLEERGLLRYDRSLTNREYLRLIAHRPDLVAVLSDVIDVFDRVWYGFQPLDSAAYARYQAQVEALKQQRS